MEKLYAAGAGLHVAERGGHTALHLACRMGAHTCARVLLQSRPQRPRGAPNTYLAQGPDHVPDTDHTPVALYPESDLGKEEDENEDDWKLQLEAENYEGHTPLHVAVIHKDAEMVRLLRKAGADLNKPVSCPRETVWQGGVIPRVGRVSSDRSAAPSRSPRAAGAPCTWQWRRKRPTCWSFF